MATPHRAILNYFKEKNLFFLKDIGVIISLLKERKCEKKCITSLSVTISRTSSTL